MKLQKITNLTSTSLDEINFDIGIISIGEDKRSAFIYEEYLKNRTSSFLYLHHSDCAEKVCGDVKCLNVSKEDVVFLSELETMILSIDKAIITIAIDYTAMSQLWYSSVLQYFKNSNSNSTIELYFFYSQAKFYTPSKDQGAVYKFRPLQGFSNLSIPTKPTALILGVGYEKRMAFSLKEFFDAEVVYVFMTDEVSSPLFSQEVKTQNLELLEQIQEETLVMYPVLDVLYIRKYLFDLCHDLSFDYRVLIAPCGPKTFSLASALVAIQIPNVDIWNISGEDIDKIKKEPNGEISFFSITFSS